MGVACTIHVSVGHHFPRDIFFPLGYKLEKRSYNVHIFAAYLGVTDNVYNTVLVFTLNDIPLKYFNFVSLIANVGSP